MENIKSIAFELNLSGNGAVNFDSSDQKFFLANHCGYNYSKDNVKLAKKAFKRLKEPVVIKTDDNGNPTQIKDTEAFLKISSECLRHAVFEKDTEFMNPKVLMSEYVSAFYATSIHSLLRGFTMLNKKDTGIVKKSCLTLPAAIDYNAQPYLELNSNAQPKEQSDGKKSTSLFFTENVGETNYVTKGFISLKELEFVSCDEFLGRMGFNPQWLEGKEPLLNKMFMKHYGNVPFKSGFFSSSTVTLSDKIGEFGIKFNEDFVIFLLKELLKRILGICIKRAGAYAMTSSLRIKFITSDCLNANLDNEDGWITLNSEIVENLGDFLKGEGLGLFDFYDELSGEDIAKTRSEIDAIINEQIKAEQAEKKEKKSKKSKSDK